MSIYAVFVTGGKQYRVNEGDRLRVERLEGEQGANVDFDKVLLVGEGADVKVGAPYVEGGSVSATITEHGRDKKIKIVKFRRRKQYMRTKGHRQGYTELKVTGISPG